MELVCTIVGFIVLTFIALNIVVPIVGILIATVIEAIGR